MRTPAILIAPVIFANCVLALNVLTQSTAITSFSGFVIGYLMVGGLLAYIAWGPGWIRRFNRVREYAVTGFVIINVLMLPYLGLTLAM